MQTSLEVPQLVVHQPARDEAEAVQLTELAKLIEAAEPLPDLRDLAPAVRELFPLPAYEVGCGGAHIWLHRAGEEQRLALVW
ncbi:hypothetical protein [Hymenobacter psychrotolerans]|uniref:Uncharacterized protein n=1 Tax=Hymenobacter psychrotolerans DSM 18569 TaxID=1121959 RepID=A0A1M6URZ0_9BACT|nr:hypothetical protein [Hymenobacter psychrotolerans]SHK71950.1 hypothetical protein SAMN02746009_01456 [Hymenobacter psychrotolerans DSM 18569]